MILGEGLAEQLKVYPGDRVWVINPVGGGVGPFGMPVPTTRTFRVAGVFYTGMYEYDTKWSYVTIPDAQAFLSLEGKVTGIEARVELERLYEVGEISAAIEEKLAYPFFTRNWLQMNAALFAALKLEKYVMGLILAQIVTVAAVGIVTNLIVMEGGIPVLTRDLPVGTRRIRETVQGRHGLEAEDVEPLLRADTASPLLHEALALQGEELAAGMERAATFLATSTRSFTQIRAVWACGGGSRIPGLLAWLGSRLRIPVQPASALAGVAVARDALDHLPVDDPAALLMLSVGLALRAA